MSALHSIEKLDESNYTSWAVQMKSVLIHLELWDYASGKVVLGSNPKPEEYAAFVAKDEKALASIMLCIKPAQINHVVHCDTAFSAWNKLKDIYQPSGPVRKITLFKRLLHRKLTDSGSISQYINDFCETVEQLAQIGVEFPDELVVIILLSNLPESYENFVVAIETRDTLPTLSALKSKLFEEETRRCEDCDQNAPVSSHQAFVAKYKNSNVNNKCFKRNNNNGNVSNSNNNNPKIKCYSCGRRGHIASQCRDQKKRPEKIAASFNMINSCRKSSLSQQMWCIDSGATCHLCCDRSLFSEFTAKAEKIVVAGNNHLLAEGFGKITIDSSRCVLNLEDVLYVPELQCNFISVHKAVKNGFKVIFDKDKAVISNKDGGSILSADNTDGLYIFSNNINSCFTAKSGVVSLSEWHNRYGHLNYDSLLKMINNNMVHGLNADNTSRQDCLTCAKGKICVQPFSASESRSKELLGIVHSDICGPMKNVSIGGARYFITFIDDMSRYIQVYFLKGKDEALKAFKEYKVMAENETGKKIKTLRTDNGGEYTCKNFASFLTSSGIKHELTVPYTPQQNGVAERANRTVTEMARCMLIHSALGENFWAEAIATAVYLRNRSETRSLSVKTPFEIWTGKVPSVKHLKVFGSLAVLLDKTHKHKFEPKGREVIMIGYSTTSKGYRLYNPETRKVIIGRDVLFLNNIYNQQKENVTTDIFLTEPEVNNEEAEILSDNDCISERHDDAEIEPVARGPGRPRIIRTGACGRPRKEYQMLNLAVPEIPATVSEALSSKHAKEWRVAMQEEYAALIKNNTWQLVDLPKNQKSVGTKWVFTVKTDKNGNVERFKSRLVAKGCSQKYGVNYTDTYSPVARYETIRLIFAVAAEYELYMDQMDVTTAYLNSEVDEDIYISQPAEFVNQEYPNRVLKLNKALYGLKQSGRQWNKKLDNILRDIGFEPCESEPCVYTRHSDDRLNIICVYVDDLLIACTNKNDMTKFKRLISNQVNIVDKGPVQNFLSIEVDRDGETGAIAISQKNHIRKLLKNYNMECCRPVSVPMDPGHQVKCENEGCKRMDQTEYQSLIGSLMYIAICTRPDILHSVCKLSQRNSDPHHEHLAAAKRILRYLSCTVDKRLQYRKTGKAIECFVDADWGGDSSDRKSYTGYVFLFGNAVVSFESKKQSAVALSSTEAEYMAMSLAVKEATYLKKLMREMKLDFPTAITVNGDNISAQNLVKNPVYHSRSKHIDIKYHHIREAYKRGEIELKYCSTNEMVADVLTKNLSKSSFERFIAMMGLY